MFSSFTPSVIGFTFPLGIQNSACNVFMICFISFYQKWLFLSLIFPNYMFDNAFKMPILENSFFYLIFKKIIA